MTHYAGGQYSNADVLHTAHQRTKPVVQPGCFDRPPISDGAVITLCTSGFEDDVSFSHDGLVARHVDFQAATEHDKRNRRDYNQS